MKFVVAALSLIPLTVVAAESLFPITQGTTWKYDLVQERTSESLDLTAPNEKKQFDVNYRLGGTQKIDNQELLKLEIYSGQTLDSVDLISVSPDGIVCPARSDSRGEITKMNPPQKMVAMPLKIGTSWNFDGTIGDTKVAQRYQITGEEDVNVPAGKFRAWRIHCEQALPRTATIDRWFVPGVGFVKVETAVKGESGSLLQKSSLTLKEPPKIQPIPQSNPIATIGELSTGLATKPNGPFKTEFKSDTPAIYVCWRGHELRMGAEIRAAFIAENVADLSADYRIDESKTTAPSPNSRGVFTLSQPEGGWTPGGYRVEFFVDDELTQAIKFKITK
jgi:hypothetical protein